MHALSGCGKPLAMMPEEALMAGVAPSAFDASADPMTMEQLNHLLSGVEDLDDLDDFDLDMGSPAPVTTPTTALLTAPMMSPSRFAPAGTMAHELDARDREKHRLRVLQDISSAMTMPTSLARFPGLRQRSLSDVSMERSPVSMSPAAAPASPTVFENINPCAEDSAMRDRLFSMYAKATPKLILRKSDRVGSRVVFRSNLRNASFPEAAIGYKTGYDTVLVAATFVCTLLNNGGIFFDGVRVGNARVV